MVNSPRKFLKLTISEIAGNASDFNTHQNISSHLCFKTGKGVKLWWECRSLVRDKSIP